MVLMFNHVAVQSKLKRKVMNIMTETAIANEIKVGKEKIRPRMDIPAPLFSSSCSLRFFSLFIIDQSGRLDGIPGLLGYFAGVLNSFRITTKDLG